MKHLLEYNESKHSWFMSEKVRSMIKDDIDSCDPLYMVDLCSDYIALFNKIVHRFNDCPNVQNLTAYAKKVRRLALAYDVPVFRKVYDRLD